MGGERGCKLKAYVHTYRGEGVSKITKSKRTYFMDDLYGYNKYSKGVVKRPKSKKNVRDLRQLNACFCG